MRNIILLFVLLLTIVSESSAMCVPKPVESEKVEGYVVFGYRGEYKILTEAEVILRDQYDEQVIDSTHIDTNGYFRLKIEPGKYTLFVHADALVSADVELNIVSLINKAHSPKDQLILVVLGADLTTPCAGTSVTVVDKSKIDAIIKSANRPGN